MISGCDSMARAEPSFKRERRGRPNDHDNTYHYAVIPGEDGQFVESGDKIPPGSGVASDKDPKGEDGKGVHEFRVVEAVRVLDCAHSWRTDSRRRFFEFQ